MNYLQCKLISIEKPNRVMHFKHIFVSLSHKPVVLNLSDSFQETFLKGILS